MMRNKRTINVVLILVLVLSLSVTAFAENWYYASNVNIVKQAKTQWCWAASAEMAGKSAYPSSTRTQWDAVAYVLGSSSINQPANSAQTCTAAERISYNRVDFRNNGVWSMANIRNEIMTLNKPLIALGGYYNSSNQRTGGHFVVIDAVYQTSNSFRYKDPWDSTQHWVSYTAFSNGSYNQRRYEETVYFR